MHFHDGYEILLILSDGGKIYINNYVYPIKSGSLFVLNKTDIHRSIGDNNNQLYEFYTIGFEPEEIEGVSTNSFDLTRCFSDHRNFNHHRLLNNDQQERILMHIERLRYYLSPECSLFGREVYCKIRLAEILIFINSIYAADNLIRESPSPQLLTDKLQPILHFIQENFAEEISLERLAEEFYISKGHLCRIFKNFTGQTINQYIINLRISKARELLKHGYSVAFTGESVGFKSPSHFIRTFKKSEGLTPKEQKKLLSVSSEFKWKDNSLLNEKTQ